MDVHMNNQCDQVLGGTMQILELAAASSAAFSFVHLSSWEKPEGIYIVCHGDEWTLKLRMIL